MNPPTTGPIVGPRNGPSVKMTIGHETSSLIHMSVIDPPATERNAAPENPARNLLTRIVAMFCATAVGTCHTIISGVSESCSTYEKQI